MTTLTDRRPYVALLLTILLATSVAAGAAEPALAQSGGENQTQSSSAEPLDIDIRQPYHVDSAVGTATKDGITTYSVTGPQHTVWIQNVDEENIERIGVRQGDATLSEAPRLDAWEFDPKGTDGTYTIYAEVYEQTESADSVIVAGNEQAVLYLTQQSPESLRQMQIDSIYEWTGNRSNIASLSEAEARQVVDWQNWEKFGSEPSWATNASVTPPAGDISRPADPAVMEALPGERETVVREARIEVTNAEMAHVSAEQYAETQEDANLWRTEIRDPLLEYVPEDRLQSAVDRGVAWVQFTENPTVAFTGTIIVIGLSFLRPGGLFWLAVLSGIPMVLLVREMAKRYRAEERAGDVEDIERRQAELDAEEARLGLSDEDYTEGPGLVERFAIPLRRHAGENLYTGTQAIAAALSPAALKQLLLAPLLNDDRHEWYAELTRADGETVDARTIAKDNLDDKDFDPDVAADGGELPDDGTVYKPIGECSADEFGVMSLDDIDSSPLRRGVPAKDLPAVDGSSAETIQEVIESQADSIGVDLESEFDDSMEDWSSAIADVLGYVASSDYTTPDGAEQPAKRVWEAIHQLFRVGAEQYEAQYYRRYQLAMRYAAVNLDDTERAQREIHRYRKEGISMHDEFEDGALDSFSVDYDGSGDGVGLGGD
jgi:hypothetical protein